MKDTVRIFRNRRKDNVQTYLEFASEKLRDFRKWVKPARVKTLEHLEEVKRKLPMNIMLYLEDKDSVDLLKASSLADSYNLIHRTSKRFEKNVKPFPDKSSETPSDLAKSSDGVIRCN